MSSDLSVRGVPEGARTSDAESDAAAPASQPVAIASAGNAAFSRYVAAGDARMPRARPAPPSSADAALGRALAGAAAQRAGSSSAARQVARSADVAAARADFNAGALVHDLRRAIDQADVTAGWVMAGMDSHATKRRVDAALVIRVLDGLTPEEIARVERLYQAQEKDKSTLRWDLLGLGQSGAPSDLAPDQRARIEALLKGTAPTAAGAPDARLEAVAVELHELLSKTLDDAGTERVMALFRRPPNQLAAVDAQYERHYGHHPSEDIARRFTGLALVRVSCLRAGDITRADALAIEAKRLALAELDGKLKSGRMMGDLGQLAHYHENRERLIDDITAVADTNRAEALEDKANVGTSSREAANQRLAKIMAIPVASPGHTLADELAFTLKGTAAAGVMATMATGTPVETAARRLAEMEARHTTSSAKIAELVRGLREQADHDVTAQIAALVSGLHEQGDHDDTAQIPHLPKSELENLRANPIGRKTELVAARADRWIKAFVAAYDDVARPAGGRAWAAIVSSADSENKEMLDALTAGAGLMAPVDQLRFAIRKKDAAAIKAVLRTLHTKEAVDALDLQYRAKFGSGLREVLLGAFGTAVAENEDAFTNAVVRGRDAAQVSEYLAAPAENELGKVNEVDLIAKHGLHEVEVTDANRGMVGSLRQLDEPETHKLMNESATQLRGLQEAWRKAEADPRLQAAILAEMKQVRATLSGDASAYEDSNAEIRAEIRSAVSFAVQVTLALTLPGVGAGMSGFIATTVVNISANVASNMVIYGNDYNLSRLYDDVIGGGLGALGGKLGEDVARLVSQEVAGAVATEAIRVAKAAGKAPKLVAEAGRAAALATEARLGLRALAEAANIAGSTAATTAATGHDGFTSEGILQNLLMNRLGHLRGAGATVPGGHGEAAAHSSGGEHHALPDVPAAGEHAAPAAVGHAPPAEPGRAPGETHPAEPGRAPDEATAAVGELDHPAEPGGAPGSRRAGSASAAERLQARAIWRKLEQLGSHWPGLGDPGRCAGLADIVNDVLVLHGVPNIRVVAESPGPGNEGAFNFREWVIRIDPAFIAEPSLSAKLVAHISELAIHENEHVLQWWTMARLRAGQGADAPQIAAEMSIPLDVAEHAAREFKAAGMSSAEQAAGQAWWNSVYGPMTLRGPILTHRADQHKRLKRLDAEIEAARKRGETVDREKLLERDELRELVAGSDLLYEGLPEERPAFERGGVAGREARLEQLALKADLANVALEHAAADLKRFEARHLSQLAASKPSDWQLRAEHAHHLERVRHLENRVDAARAAHEEMADAIAPPETLRDDDPSDTQTDLPQVAEPASSPSDPPPVESAESSSESTTSSPTDVTKRMPAVSPEPHVDSEAPEGQQGPELPPGGGSTTPQPPGSRNAAGADAHGSRPATQPTRRPAAKAGPESVPAAHEQSSTATPMKPEAPVIEQSPPGGFPLEGEPHVPAEPEWAPAEPPHEIDVESLPDAEAPEIHESPPGGYPLKDEPHVPAEPEWAPAEPPHEIDVESLPDPEALADELPSRHARKPPPDPWADEPTVAWEDIPTETDAPAFEDTPTGQFEDSPTRAWDVPQDQLPMSDLWPGTIIDRESPLTRTEAEGIYENTIADSNGRHEAQVMENMRTGERIVIQGDRYATAASPGAMVELFRQANKKGPWRSVRHFHAVDAGGVTEPIFRYPSGKGGDMSDARAHALKHRQMHIEILDIVTENGRQKVYYGYDPGAESPFFVGLPSRGGLPEYHYFKDLDAYHHFVEQATGQPLPVLDGGGPFSRAASSPQDQSETTGPGEFDNRPTDVDLDPWGADPEHRVPEPDEHIMRAELDQLLAELGQRPLHITEITPGEAAKLYEFLSGLTFPDAKGVEIPVPFHYPADGCWGRAHIMAEAMAAAGIKSERVFATSTVPGSPLEVASNHSTDQKRLGPPTTPWVYHVAPIVNVRTTVGVEHFVFDPSTQTRPVPVSEWLATMGVTAGSYRELTHQQLMDHLAASQGGPLTHGFPPNERLVWTTDRHTMNPTDGPASDSTRANEQLADQHTRLSGYAYAAAVHEAAAAVREVLARPDATAADLVDAVRRSGPAAKYLWWMFPSLHGDARARFPQDHDAIDGAVRP